MAARTARPASKTLATPQRARLNVKPEGPVKLKQMDQGASKPDEKRSAPSQPKRAQVTVAAARPNGLAKQANRTAPKPKSGGTRTRSR